MIRTIVYFLLASVALGVIATPGLALFALVLVPAFGFMLVWRVALFVVTGGHPSEAILRTNDRHLLGPGGQDNPFASERFDEDEYSTRELPTARAA